MFTQPLNLTSRLYRAAPRDENASFNNRSNKKLEVLQLFNSKEQEDALRTKKDAWRDEEEDATRVAKRLRSFRCYTAEEEAEEKRNGVSTRLKLYEDPWKIKKVLEYNDVENCCCLTISRRMVYQHIFQVWIKYGKKENVRSLVNGREIQVTVWDCDRRREYKLSLKNLGSTDCYVFSQNWDEQFVVERGLKRGDKIGMFWCICSNRFFFMLLDRAAES